MKKSFLLSSLIISLIYSQELPKIQPSIIELEKKEIDLKYPYIAGGALFLMAPEVSTGLRTVSGSHGFDIHIGASIQGVSYWAQTFYLYYVEPLMKPQNRYSSPYLGLGLSVGRSELSLLPFGGRNKSFYLNIPVTFGYEWGDEKAHQFFQCQLPSSTITYGFGF